MCCYDGTIMAQRTQISLPDEDHRRARARASDLGVSLAEYIRRLVAADLRTERTAAPVDALFDLGSSADGSDISARKDAYIGDAVRAESGRGSAR
jgi:plasmid stability protein